MVPNRIGKEELDMPKKESQLREALEALGILKQYQTSWAAAASNRVLRELLAQDERDLLETIYRLETERKEGGKSGIRKKSSQTD